MVDLETGSALGPYVIAGPLGRGGMASVYRAHHVALDRDVAIKVIWPSLAEAPGFLERFQREARAVSRLRHPNILNIYDFGRQDGTIYMVTELLPGGSLADRLRRPSSLRDALDVARGVGAALDYAHGQGIMHRDVKPSNILYSADGTPVLADFGIARMSAEAEQLTVQGTLVGTPEYMSPEQAVGREVGTASDLYSLGIVLYQMVNGTPPFRFDSAVATLRAHVDEPVPPTRVVNPQLPAQLDVVLERALAKNPRERYLNGAALANAFAAAIEKATVPVAAPLDRTMVMDAGGTQVNVGVPMAAPPSAQRNARVKRALLLLAGVTAVCAVLLFALRSIFWSSPASPLPTPTRIIEGAVPGSVGATPVGVATIAPPQAAASPAIQTPAAKPTASPAPTELPVAAPEPTVQIAAASPEPSELPSPVVVVLPTATLAAAASPTPQAAQAVPPTPQATPAAPPTQPAAPTVPSKPSAPPPATAAPATAAPAAPVAPPPGGSQPVSAQPGTSKPTGTQPSATKPGANPPGGNQPAGGNQPTGPLTAQITSPANNAQVSARPTISGRVAPRLPGDQHLWMLVQPSGPNDNWWLHPDEIDPNDRGEWQVRDADIAGPGGSVHTIVVGVVDDAAHRQLQQAVAARPGQPLNGLPPGFRELHRVTVTKGG